jgi:Carboxypeptidase regulatory-like domain
MGARKTSGGRCGFFVGVLALFLLMLMVIPASAQESGTILGVVKDASAGVVPGAKITVTNLATNEARTVMTAEDGAYRVPALRAGQYTVKVEAQGFQTQIQTGLTLNVAAELVANITLQVGSATQEVTVTTESPVVNTTTSSLGGLVNDQTIAELPLNGRNYLDLTLLQPGVQASSHGSGAGSSGTWYSSNGAPSRSNNFTLDGAPLVNQYGTGANSIAGSTLGVDGIREYKVVTNMFSAEYGMTMGSQMVIVSKGGTNRWSGDAFEYLRNDHMDARNFFEAQPAQLGGRRIPPFQRNDFGASFGGPIRKDKTFFYLVYEGLRTAQGDTITTQTLPAACHFVQPADSNGSAVGSPVIIGGGPIPSGITPPAGAVQKIFQGPISTVVPGATQAMLTSASQCTSGLSTNQLVAAVVQPWIGQFPFPTSGTANYTFPGKTRIREDYSQLRVDHSFSANDTFFARGTFDDTHMTTPYAASLVSSDSGAGFPQYDTLGKSRNQFYTLGENHIFSSSLLNSFRLSFSRTQFTASFDQFFTPMNPDFILQDAADSPCFAAVNPTCVWSFIPGQLTAGFNPGGGTTQLTGPGTTYPTYHIQNVWTLADDIFYTRGKHAFKFGVLLNRYQNNSLNAKGTGGAIAFGSISNFIKGFATSYNAVLPYPQFLLSGNSSLLAPPFNGNYLDRANTYRTQGFYVQDDWRATTRLTVNMGLRYETMTEPNELYGRYGTIPDIATSSTYAIGSFLRNPTLRNFSPRVGFAWDVLGNGKTAIRSGFGIYYDVGNIGQLLSSQGPNGVPPFGVQTQVQQPASTVIALPLPFPNSSFGKALQYTDYNIKNPHLMQWNLTVEQQLPLGFGLSASFVGNRGINIGTLMEGNPVVPDHYTNGLPIYNTSDAPDAARPADAAASCFNNALTVGQPLIIKGVTINPGDAAYPCRVNPFWTSTLFATAASNSWYSGLQILVTKRLSRGLQLQGSYTYSRAIDTTMGMAYRNDCAASGADIGVSPSNLSLDKGVGCSDIPHALRLNLLYHLPNLQSNGFVSKLVNGWWIGNIVTVQGGFPATPLITGERSFSGVATASNNDHASLNTAPNSAIQVPGAAAGTLYQWIPYDPGTVNTGDPNHWWNVLMFGQQPLGQLGTSPRDILRMPGLGNWDFSLAKDTKLGFLGEAGSLQFRAEFFNIMNRANFGIPNGTAFTADTSKPCPASGGCNIGAANGSSAANPLGSFGLITSTSTTARQIQLALKVIF